MGMIGNTPYQGIIQSGNIQDGAITTTKVADAALTAAKLSAAAVTDKLGFTPVNKAGDTMTGNLTVPQVNADLNGGLFVQSSNEMTLARGIATGAVYQNYRGAAGAITEHIMCDGMGGGALSGVRSKSTAAGWVTFSPSSSSVVRYSYNVSSVTAVVAGQYRINWTRSINGGNYAVICNGTERNSDSPGGTPGVCRFISPSYNNRTSAWVDLSVLADQNIGALASDISTVEAVAFATGT